MDYIKSILILIFVSFKVFALNELPELYTKQNIEKIRFFSKDGKYVYYQEATGDLVLATNFSTKDILKGEKDVFHLLQSSPTGKKIVIQSTTNFHQNNEINQSGKISVMDFEGTNLTEIGEGINPKLHLQDTWISYYKPLEKTIYFNSLQIKNLTFTISLQNKINPYFIPDVVMYNLNFVLFTDINDEGISAIIQYERNSKKNEIIYKTAQNGTKIELCLKNKDLVIGQFPLSDTNKNSSIYLLNVEGELKDKNMKPLYESHLPDIGNIVCELHDDFIYFSQATSDFKNFPTYESEIVSLNIKDKKIEKLTDLKYANQLVYMDDNLYLSWRGKYFIVRGKNTLKMDTLKQSSTNGDAE